MSKATTRGIALRRTALAVALFGVFGYVPSSGAVDLVVGNEHDLGQSNMTSSTITVIDGGVLTGDGASVSGSAYDVLRVDSGGSATLVNTSLSNDLDHPTGTNGRTARATGANANLTLIDSDIGISAHSTNAGADYNHAFTAGVGADGGGHVDIQGGSITAEGSKRTVGMQANDGGSISARDLEITTHNHFGHAVQVYRNPAGAEIDTYVSLDRVSIRTLGENYSLGVQVANKGASLAATDTSIVTEGAASSGVEVFNGATAELVNGSITTKGDVAAGVRVYGGALGSGLVSVDGTRIVTEGQYSSGILAGDAAEPTSGVVGVRNVDIATAGNHASGIEAAHGSLVLSTDSSLRTGGDQAHGVYIHNGGSAALNGDSITTDGLHSYGMFASGSGSTISAVDTNVTTNGIRGYGAHADGGGVVDLEGGSVTTANPKGQGSQDGDGSRAYALYAKGAGSEIRSQGGTQVTTLGQRAYGAYAEHGGRIELNDATIATHGFMAYGIYANWEGSTIEANNVDITTTGEVGDGVWAWSGVVNLNGGSVTVGGEPNPNWPHETANGLVAVGGTDLEAGGVINATGARIRTMGTDSAGVVAGARNGTVPVKGTVNLTDSSVDVLGEGSVAARVSYGGTLNATGSMLRSAQGNGIVMTDDATVHLVGTNIEAARASLVSNLNSAGRTQNIVIGSGSTLTMNNGTLLQVNRSSEGMDGVVNLTLGAGSSARGDIVDLDGLSPGSPAREGRTNFIVDSGASWVGMVQGINDVSMEDGTSFVDEGGAPIAGNVRVGENATLIFNNGATIGGGLSTSTGTQGIFNGAATLGGSIVGTGSILRFNDSANIGGGISTASTTVAFSTSAPTIIGGDVDLDQGSVLNGGSSATPVVIHGNANVHNGSILGGNLFVEGALGGSGGTLSPGNSIGTQSYATSAGFSGAYVAEVNGKGLSDLIVIRDGNFDLSGIGLTVAQENGDGGYLLNHAYTIVRTEAGDIVNEFASETLDPVSFANARVRLDPVQYGQKNVQISLSVDEAGIDSTSWSPNQQAAYRGVISAGSGNPLAFAVLASPDMDNALNQISGELHGSTQAALLNASHLMVRTLSNRMRDSLSAGAIPVPANPDASAITSGYPLWAEVVGNWSTLDSDGNAAKVDTRTGGLFLGGDAEAGQGWRVGGALGFTDGQVKVDGRSSKSDVTSYTAALYAGNSWPTGRGNLNWLGGFAYTHHDIDTRRSVSVGGPQTLKAGYKANTTQLFAELAHTFPLGQASTLEPYLGLAWASQRAKSFAETGGVAALRGKSTHDDVVSTTVGLRGATALDMGDRQATLKGGLGWRHAAGDIDPRRHMAFRQGGGAEFAVAGAPIAKNAAVVDLSAEFSIGKKSSAGLSYAGQFGDGNTDNSASLYWKTRF